MNPPLNSGSAGAENELTSESIDGADDPSLLGDNWFGHDIVVGDPFHTIFGEFNDDGVVYWLFSESKLILDFLLFVLIEGSSSGVLVDDQLDGCEINVVVGTHVLKSTNNRGCSYMCEVVGDGGFSCGGKKSEESWFTWEKTFDKNNSLNGGGEAPISVSTRFLGEFMWLFSSMKETKESCWQTSCVILLLDDHPKWLNRSLNL